MMSDEEWENIKKKILNSGWFMSWYFVNDMAEVFKYTDELRRENIKLRKEHGKL